jgi:hypothetical protein
MGPCHLPDRFRGRIGRFHVRRLRRVIVIGQVGFHMAQRRDQAANRHGKQTCDDAGLIIVDESGDDLDPAWVP